VGFSSNSTQRDADVACTTNPEWAVNDAPRCSRSETNLRVQIECVLRQKNSHKQQTEGVAFVQYNSPLAAFITQVKNPTVILMPIGNPETRIALH
jgi:hypothetical protein